jgi:hypothetical protein
MGSLRPAQSSLTQHATFFLTGQLIEDPEANESQLEKKLYSIPERASFIPGKTCRFDFQFFFTFAFFSPIIVK